MRLREWTRNQADRRDKMNSADFRPEFVALRTEARALVGNRWPELLGDAFHDLLGGWDEFVNGKPCRGYLYTQAAAKVIADAKRKAARG
jgi:hypothetical protein